MFILKNYYYEQRRGTSNKNIKNIFNSNREILKILKENSIYSNILFIMIKLVLSFAKKLFVVLFIKK